MLELLVILFTAMFISGILSILVFIWYALIFMLMIAFVVWLWKLFFGDEK